MRVVVRHEGGFYPPAAYRPAVRAGTGASAIAAPAVPGPVERTEPVIVITTRRDRDGSPAGAAGSPGPAGSARPGSSAEEAKREIARELAAREAEVRAHELAHLVSLGGAAAGPVVYGYVTGPDGQAYADSGRIRVDLEPVPGDPAATLRKAQAVQQAAHAPGSPSAPDMRVAADAYRLEMQARRELRSQPASDGSGGPVSLLA